MTNLTPPAPGDSYALYRHFDTEGKLLYVGISSDFALFLADHPEYVVVTGDTPGSREDENG